jgi:hypothetical protein
VPLPGRRATGVCRSSHAANHHRPGPRPAPPGRVVRTRSPHGCGFRRTAIRLAPQRQPVAPVACDRFAPSTTDQLGAGPSQANSVIHHDVRRRRRRVSLHHLVLLALPGEQGPRLTIASASPVSAALRYHCIAWSSWPRFLSRAPRLTIAATFPASAALRYHSTDKRLLTRQRQPPSLLLQSRAHDRQAATAPGRAADQPGLPARRLPPAATRPTGERGDRSGRGVGVLHGGRELPGALLRRRRIHPHDLPAVAVEVEEAA